MQLGRLAIAVVADKGIGLLGHLCSCLANWNGLQASVSVACADPVTYDLLQGMGGMQVVDASRCTAPATWHAALDLAGAMNPDLVLILSPCDLPSIGYLRRAVAVLERDENDGYDVVALRSWYDYNAGAEESGMGCLRRIMLGPSMRWATPWRGRLYRAKALDRAGWRLFEPDATGLTERRDAAVPGPLRTFYSGTHDGGALLNIRRDDADALCQDWPDAAKRDQVLDFERKSRLLHDSFRLDERTMLDTLWFPSRG